MPDTYTSKTANHRYIVCWSLLNTAEHLSTHDTHIATHMHRPYVDVSHRRGWSSTKLCSTTPTPPPDSIPVRMPFTLCHSQKTSTARPYGHAKLFPATHKSHSHGGGGGGDSSVLDVNYPPTNRWLEAPLGGGGGGGWIGASLFSGGPSWGHRSRGQRGP